MHLQYVHFEGRWEDYRREAWLASRSEAMNRRSAEGGLRQAERIGRGFDNLGEYLDEKRDWVGIRWVEDVPWMHYVGDPHDAPPPPAAYLRWEAAFYRSSAEVWRRAAEADAARRRAYLGRWW